MLRYRRNKAYHKLRTIEEGFFNGFEALIIGYSDPFEELCEEFAQTKWNRILNMSVEGDELIKRIRPICQISKIFEDQVYYVLKS